MHELNLLNLQKAFGGKIAVLFHPSKQKSESVVQTSVSHPVLNEGKKVKSTTQIPWLLFVWEILNSLAIYPKFLPVIMLRWNKLPTSSSREEWGVRFACIVYTLWSFRTSSFIFLFHTFTLRIRTCLLRLNSCDKESRLADLLHRFMNSGLQKSRLVQKVQRLHSTNKRFLSTAQCFATSDMIGMLE